jgi:hypothetical protein
VAFSPSPSDELWPGALNKMSKCSVDYIVAEGSRLMRVVVQPLYSV